jgi:hypothetical protein
LEFFSFEPSPSCIWRRSHPPPPNPTASSSCSMSNRRPTSLRGSTRRPSPSADPVSKPNFVSLDPRARCGSSCPPVWSVLDWCSWAGGLIRRVGGAGVHAGHPGARPRDLLREKCKGTAATGSVLVIPNVRVC